jgi:uncharacterized membrane protein (UPF0127 family)
VISSDRFARRPAVQEPWLHVDGRRTGLLVRRAETFLARAIGLLDSSPRWAGHVALEIRPCFAVHTFGMRHPIDVAFVDAHGRVQRLVEALPAWRAAWSPGARAAWELPAGSARALRISRGVQLAAPGWASRREEPGAMRAAAPTHHDAAGRGHQ